MKSDLAKKFPSEVKKIFTIFGEEIRLVGGSVRDLILKKKVSDFDFATKFLPQEVIKILEKNKIKAVPTGVKYGTITAVINHKNFEITTLRKDNETDGRYCEPEFVDDFFLDASRRDFTINALYLDSTGFISDYFDGISDLKNKKVRFIGSAKTRIEEDFLRILRFFRFSCEYAAELDSEGLKACVSQKKNLKKLSRERVRQEFLKLIFGSKKEKIIALLQVLKSKKIAAEIFSSDLDVKALERLFDLEKKLNFIASSQLKLAVIFLQKNLDLKNLTKEICATNLERKYFQFLLSNLETKDSKELLAFAEKDLVLDSYIFNSIKNSAAMQKKNIEFLQKFSSPKFPLNGTDIMRLGIKDKAVGEAMIAAKKFWANGDFKSDKRSLISFLRDNHRI